MNIQNCNVRRSASLAMEMCEKNSALVCWIHVRILPSYIESLNPWRSSTCRDLTSDQSRSGKVYLFWVLNYTQALPLKSTAQSSAPWEAPRENLSFFQKVTAQALVRPSIPSGPVLTAAVSRDAAELLSVVLSSHIGKFSTHKLYPVIGKSHNQFQDQSTHLVFRKQCFFIRDFLPVCSCIYIYGTSYLFLSMRWIVRSQQKCMSPLQHPVPNWRKPS